MNVLLSLILVIVLSFLSGCSVLPKLGKDPVKPVEIQTKAVERTRLNIPELPPMKARTVEWIIITPENAEEVWKRLKEKNIDVVLFGITDDGYQELALNYAEIRNYINSQRLVIKKYREYYEPEEKKEPTAPQQK